MTGDTSHVTNTPRCPDNSFDSHCYHRSAAPNENSRLYVFSQTIERPSLGMIKTQPRTTFRIAAVQIAAFLNRRRSVSRIAEIAPGCYFERELSISGERYLNTIRRTLSTSIFRGAPEYWLNQM